MHASLEIGRVLADREAVTFAVHGTCMYPTVRPGDILRIRSCSAARASVGDIAVCRTSTGLLGHRVIQTGERDGRAYVVTRPDRSREGSDAPTFDEDLLGVVVGISRKGAPAPLQQGTPTRVVRWYHRLRVASLDAEPLLRQSLASVLGRVQNWRLYGPCARWWVAASKPSVRFAVRIPSGGPLADAVSGEVEASDFDPASPWRGQPVERWTLIAQVSGAREPAAWTTHARDPDAGWREEDAGVRLRYRGTGLSEALLRVATEILARSAGTRALGP